MKAETSLFKVRACLGLCALGVLLCLYAQHYTTFPWDILWALPSALLGGCGGTALGILTFDRAKLK